MTGSGVLIDPSSPVLPGQSACINSSDPSSTVQLSCVITNLNESIDTTITWRHIESNMTLATTTTSPMTDRLTITANRNGTYNCSARNECGSTSGSVTVASKFIMIKELLQVNYF